MSTLIYHLLNGYQIFCVSSHTTTVCRAVCVCVCVCARACAWVCVCVRVSDVTVLQQHVPVCIYITAWQRGPRPFGCPDTDHFEESIGVQECHISHYLSLSLSLSLSLRGEPENRTRWAV